MKFKSHTLALAAVIAASVAPVAAASTGPPTAHDVGITSKPTTPAYSPGYHDVGITAHPITPAPTAVDKNDAALKHGAGQLDQFGPRAFSTGNVKTLRYRRPDIPSASLAVKPDAGGFSWTDAGAGAGGALVLIAAAVGGTIAFRRRSPKLEARRSPATY